jgi:hypothetical protein
VPDDLVKIEDVYLAGVEFREAIADVVEEKAELLVVIGGDRLPGCTPLRLFITGVQIVISCHRANGNRGIDGGLLRSTSVRENATPEANRLFPEPSFGIDPRWPMAKSDAAPDG